jgi:hypothetical protein
MSRWLKEPLLHFLLIGAGLFVLFYRVADPETVADDRIQISAADIERMTVLFNRKWQRPPSPKEIDGLIEAQIREEVLYREALAMSLDEDDTIVRRRMGQKMEFLFKDVAEASEPSEAELQAYYEEHPDKFSAAGRTSFDHVYLNTDQRGSDAVTAARDLLPALNADRGGSDPATIGDRFMLGNRFDHQTDQQIARMFGRAFVQALATLESGAWQGPVESGYGLHLVYIRERTPERLPPMAEVRPMVLREFLAERRREADQAFYKTLRDRYTVVVERPEGEARRGARIVEPQ